MQKIPEVNHRPPRSGDRCFFYSDRRYGGLGTFRLIDDADVWTVARATQLLASKDPTMRQLFTAQFKDTISCCFNLEAPPVLPIGPYLSGLTDGDLYLLRFAQAGLNVWTLARRAALRLSALIDVSSDQEILIIADDISLPHVKAVRGLRTAVCEHWCRRFLDSPHQGQVASGLALDSTSKDMARLLSCRTNLKVVD